MKITERISLTKRYQAYEDEKVKENRKEVTAIHFLNRDEKYYLVIEDNEFPIDKEDYYHIRRNKFKIEKEYVSIYKKEYEVVSDYYYDYCEDDEDIKDHTTIYPERWLIEITINIDIIDEDKIF